MKIKELKEIIKASMLAETSVEETLVDADQDMAEAILNALGGEAAFEAVVRAMSTDDAQTYLGAIMRDHNIRMEPAGDIPGFEGTMDALDSLSIREEEEEAKKDEEEEEVEDVEVDAEEEITLDEPEEEEMDTDVEAPSAKELSGDEKELQSNLEKALGAAKAMGDEKLSNQIGNTITFFTRTHVVGDTSNVEEAEIGMELEEGAADNLELKNLAKKLFLGFKRMGADVQLTTTKMQLNKAPENGTDDKWGYDQKNVWIYVDDDHISINLVGEKAGGFFGKIQKDFPDFEFKDEGDSKSWNGLNVKNLQIKPGKTTSESLNETFTRMQKLAGIIK